MATMDPKLTIELPDADGVLLSKRHHAVLQIAEAAFHKAVTTESCTFEWARSTRVAACKWGVVSVRARGDYGETPVGEMTLTLPCMFHVSLYDAMRLMAKTLNAAPDRIALFELAEDEERRDYFRIGLCCVFTPDWRCTRRAIVEAVQSGWCRMLRAYSDGRPYFMACVPPAAPAEPATSDAATVLETP